METIQARYSQVLERMEQAARSVGRTMDDLTLVVVTKNHPVEVIEGLAALGVRDIGENRVEEALQKQAQLQNDAQITWHMIGHVQSRKAKLVSGRFAWIHSLDRLKLAHKLAEAADQTAGKQPVLLQFNVSGEESKFGWAADDPAHWPELLPEIEQILALQALEVRGLMTIAPYSDDPEDARPSFVRLRKFRDFLAARYPAFRWEQLSMGMSGDYQAAIQEGATMVRIGTAILGERYGIIH